MDSIECVMPLVFSHLDNCESICNGFIALAPTLSPVGAVSLYKDTKARFLTYGVNDRIVKKRVVKRLKALSMKQTTFWLNWDFPTQPIIVPFDDDVLEAENTLREIKERAVLRAKCFDVMRTSVGRRWACAIRGGMSS
jgi:hypothetical protein